MTSPVAGGSRPAAAFFDLDKTIIAKSATLAFGPSFYRNGLISRGDAVRSAVAQLLFSRHGASHQRMERIREHVGQLCRAWPAERVRELAAERGYRLAGCYARTATRSPTCRCWRRSAARTR